jgi:hypothetical protein
MIPTKRRSRSSVALAIRDGALHATAIAFSVVSLGCAILWARGYRMRDELCVSRRVIERPLGNVPGPAVLVVDDSVSVVSERSGISVLRSKIVDGRPIWEDIETEGERLAGFGLKIVRTSGPARNSWNGLSRYLGFEAGSTSSGARACYELSGQFASRVSMITANTAKCIPASVEARRS